MGFKDVLRFSWLKIIFTAVFFAIMMYMSTVPAWLRMRSGPPQFFFANYHQLFVEHNFSRVTFFGTFVYLQYWYLSYLIAFVELFLFYSVISLVMSAITRKNKA
ncbi:hypothetical protein KY337_00615 [Candidatus Woesearchaeota archaeon]|nr:hypothetical protein [Candidatus Woesearchaeota archaeon]